MSAMRRGRDAPLAAWFAARGWKPAPFQRETWRRYLDGESGLLHTPTGSGKTLAAFGGPLLEALAGDAPMAPVKGRGCCGSRRCGRSPPTPPAR
ncbi:Helicase domain protein [Achromobacter xylosoxidans]|uniref:Helicase domain protein n=1 Tax=Alcaligenes xylosoxydans xylosoxydans TaxID=85698 RepID=UPI0003D5E173|nr:Helicase domain protein [Achromobacter xylosoxidans]AHC49681.1 Helicase domain protein [Achromobacter xylosoxidans NBRC 15126 = ATCC 27061]CKI12760.1 Lhr-like helicases [Achromobacter xylosoxidans]SQG77343.1 Lhr-like helicases [Achromobacter xylosoxidans]